MSRNIELKLSTLEFITLCDCLDVSNGNEITENVAKVCSYEMMFNLHMRLTKLLTPRNEKTTVDLNIREASLVDYITQFDYHSVLTNVAMLDIHEQIREETA